VGMAGADEIDLHKAIGGTAACRELASAFYARVDRDPLLRPLFPGTTLRCAIEEFSAFLVQFLGGPNEDAQKRWWLSLRESHRRFKIGPKERETWMRCMVQTLDESEIEETMRCALRGLFERSSAYVIDAPATIAPTGDPIHLELSRRWDVQLEMDEAVAAIRGGNGERAMAIAESCSRRAMLVALLSMMTRSGDAALLRYVGEKIAQDPELVRERFAGRTLLHEASAQGHLALVESLLRLGADANVATGGGHTPLYCLANQYKAPAGASEIADVVRTLVRSGANVNAADGVKHCTPLHMAARRGSVEVAKVLLECGAEVEARDSVGDTSLRRAVNCDKTAVAAVLLKSGADVRSLGSKGKTPMTAARSGAMKETLNGPTS
jgi:truncated hemoglobin YjbI